MFVIHLMNANKQSPNKLSLDAENLSVELSNSLLSKEKSNIFELSISSEEILSGKNLYLEILSTNLDLMLSIYDTEEGYS